jgi:site-specific DNA recombinase
MAHKPGGTSSFLLNTIDLNPHSLPLQPGAYVRISDDQSGLARGVNNQQSDCTQKGAALGWGPIAKFYVENDTSAFRKRRVVLADGSVGYRNVRPQFIEMMADLASGAIDGLLVYDQDRLLRQPRDLEDLVDLCERKRMPAVAVTGAIDLLTSNGRMMARFLAAQAIKSSEDTSRRVARSALADAEAGKLVLGGPRRYGWEKDGMTVVPSEAAVILELRDRMMAGGEGVGLLAAELRARGLATSTGAAWTQVTVNTILRSPRLAGIRGYQGVHHGQKKPTINQWSERTTKIEGEYVMGPWEPIMSVPGWEALQYSLDARRKENTKHVTGPRPAGAPSRGNPKYLLSGIAECGNCGTRMIGRASYGRTAYGCRPKDLGGCNAVSRNMEKVDRLVLQLAIRKLLSSSVTRSDPTPPTVDDTEARIARIETRKAELKAAWTGSLLPGPEYFALNSELNAVLEREQAERRATLAEAYKPARTVAVEELSGTKASTARKRHLLGEVIEAVVIHKSSRGPHFVETDISIRWRDEMAE